MAKLVTVYDRDGKPHNKSLANARDMVTHSGWTWKPGHKQLPTMGQPYAGIERDTDTKKRVQAVLDRARHPTEAPSTMVEVHDELPPAPQISFVEVPDHEIALGLTDLEVTEDGEGEADEAPALAAEAPAEDAKPRRRRPAAEKA